LGQAPRARPAKRQARDVNVDFMRME